MARPRLHLIQPKFFNPKLDRNQGVLPPLGLAYVAAYTPAGWDISILDEQVEEFRMVDADVVGITTTTGNITRAYEIAARYRARGATVILGGVHASMVPEEAMERCDAVVCGDAEGVWEQVLADWEAGTLKKKYDAPILPLAGLRHPRRDLLSDRYLLGAISSSRGCPLKCTFCAIHNFYQHEYRLRPVEDVIAELRTMRHRAVFFTDGNMYGYHRKARDRFVELCRAIAAEKKKGTLRMRWWMAYATVNIVDDDEALEAAAAAGCRNLLVGFESVNPASLKEMKKGPNIKRSKSYGELIRKAASYGIMITAEMVLGFDSDTAETIEATRRFVQDTDFDILRLQLLQPLPGTETFEKLDQEDRLFIGDFPADWDQIRDNFILGVLFEPKQLDPYTMKQTVVDIGRSFYSLPAIAKKAVRSLTRFKSPMLTAYFVILSLKSRKTYYNYTLDRAAVERELAAWRDKLRARIAARGPRTVTPLVQLRTDRRAKAVAEAKELVEG